MKAAQLEALSFEDAFTLLEEVVQRMEGGDLPLEESLSLYEKGMSLSHRCQALLDQAELRVSELIDTGDQLELPSK